MLHYSQEEARRSVMDLRSQALESRDLAARSRTWSSRCTIGPDVVARVTVEGTPRRLDAFDEHHLLRIGLEALTNALKHSGALRIDIVLRFEPDSVELTVRDDGCGLTIDQRDQPAGHFGLHGIRERVDKLGGVLQSTARPAPEPY